MTNEDPPLVPAHGTIPDTSPDILAVIAGNNASNARVSPAWDGVKATIVEFIGVTEDRVTPTARFVEDLGCDSLDVVELVMSFEDKFNIEIPDHEAEQITTVASAVFLIDTKKAMS